MRKEAAGIRVRVCNVNIFYVVQCSYRGLESKSESVPVTESINVFKPLVEHLNPLFWILGAFCAL